MGKNKRVFNDDLQFGRQTPDGKIEWHGEAVAHKLGWTTTDGRLRAQIEYDTDIRSLGLRLDENNLLRFYTRRRVFTDRQIIEDFEPGAAVDDILDHEGFPQEPVADEDRPTPSQIIDVSDAGLEGDPSHIIVDENGLLVGSITPTEPAVVTGGQAIVLKDNAVPAAEQTQVIPPAVLQEDETVVKSADLPAAPISATPF